MIAGQAIDKLAGIKIGALVQEVGVLQLYALSIGHDECRSRHFQIKSQLIQLTLVISPVGAYFNPEFEVNTLTDQLL